MKTAAIRVIAQTKTAIVHAIAKTPTHVIASPIAATTAIANAMKPKTTEVVAGTTVNVANQTPKSLSGTYREGFFYLDRGILVTCYLNASLNMR
ncbi:MAG TPA: hypothetical protein VK177_14500 [Flavobacteriales bacterium]|nr:hypothetical protein [Flavobacteriales bacterium]